MTVTTSSRRRILLLYPETPDASYWSYSRALPFLGKSALLPPLGLLTVAGMFPSGYELKLKDLNVESCSDEEMRWADAVFVSAMIAQKDSLARCIARANRLGIPVVAGGPYPTTSYAEIPGIAHFVLGEAETVFPVFLREWERGDAKRAYARPADAAETEKIRAYFGDDANVETVGDRVCLDDSPEPRFDLLNLRAYRSMAVQTSRGCPHGCEFCDIWRRFGRRMRYKSVSRVLAEFSALYRLGWRSSVFIVDDNFVGAPRQAKELLAALTAWQAERRHPFEFCTEASLTLADDKDMLQKMGDAGFNMVFVGLETPVEESLRETRKYVNTSGGMAERVARIQAAGLQVSSGFILGFDSDPADIAARMTQSIQDLGIPVAMVGLLQALPETDIHDRLEREGRLLHASDGNNTHEFSLGFVPRRPAADLIADYKQVLRTLYSNTLRSYFARCAQLRERWGRTRPIKQPVRRVEIGWLLRYLAGAIFKPYAWNSLRFLIETAWKKPAFFPVAASLAIQGHHFREITRLSFRLDALKQSYAELSGRFFARIRCEQETLHRDLGRYLREGQGAVIARVEKSVAAIEKYRQSLQREASRRAKRLSRNARQAVLSLYESLCGELDQAVVEFRRGVIDKCGSQTLQRAGCAASRNSIANNG